MAKKKTSKKVSKKLNTKEDDVKDKDVSEKKDGIEKEKELLEYLLKIRETISEKYDIRCSVFGVILNNSDKPAVAYDGNIMDRASFASAISKMFKDQVMESIEEGKLN